MTPEEILALFSLVDTCRELIEAEFSSAGYNIGFNVGLASGQTTGGLLLQHIFLEWRGWRGFKRNRVRVVKKNI